MKQMKWKRMMFKGCKVYAQVDEGGNLLTQNGLVEIKYQLDQDMKYLARASSVKEIDEVFLNKIKKERKKEKEALKKKSLPTSLKKNHDDYIKVFTDGACEGNPGPAGIGIILQYRNHQKEISRYIGQGTNSIAELTAIKLALREIKDPNLPIDLYTDSDYCYKILSGSWKPKKNQKLIEEIKKEMARFSCLNLIKVEGHKGIEGNERADRLAREAIKKGGRKKHVTGDDKNH
jgi:ribonuclease HI